MNIFAKLSSSVAVAALLCGAAPKRGSARQACHDVRGTIDTAFSSAACAAATGLCTSGTISGVGRLDGTTAYEVDAMAGAAGPEATSYAGVLTVTARRGTLTLQDMGVVDFGAGIYTEYLVVTGGTGSFTGATGTLFASGFVTAGGFGGAITGQLCDSSDDD